MGIRVFRPILLLVVAAALVPVPYQAAERSDRFVDPSATVRYPRDRTVDFRHLVLDVSFDWERRWVGGKATYTLTPLAHPVRTVELDADDLRVHGVEGEEAPMSYRVTGDKLLIDLGWEVPPGEQATFTVSYEANPGRGLYFGGARNDAARPPHIWSQGEAEDNRAWFPGWDYPNDKMTFEEIYTVPAPWSVLGNGELVDARDNPEQGTRTFHYRQDIPSVTYLVSVAAGEFDVVRDDWNGMPVEYWVPAGTPEETTMRSFRQTTDMLDYFSDRIGIPYPYAKYAQVTVSDFVVGGMENVSATTLTLETLHPERVESEASSLGLVAHELAHQWWGDLLTCRDWSHAWLNEGFATYFGALYLGHHKGKDELQYQLISNARDYFEEDEEEYRRSIVQTIYTDPFDLFDAHLYPKAGWTLHMLRGVVGDDLFWKTIRAYAANHAGTSVTTEDLRRTFETVTGQGLVWFFDQWYNHGGHPEFRVRQSWDVEDGLARLQIEQIQGVDELTPVFRMPVRIVFSGEGWSREHRIDISRRSEDFRFELPEPPRLTRFDAGQWILKKLQFERSLDELDYQLRRDPDVAGRVWAAGQLAERTADRRAAEILAAALREEPFWGVRADIATALGKLHLGDTRADLVDALADPDTRVRIAALEGLGEYREDPAAAAAIRSAFDANTNEYVRGAAAKAYATAAPEGALDFLVEAAAIPSYRERIANGAYEGMAELQNAGAVPVLKDGAGAGNTRRRREGAIKALGKMASGDDRDEVVGFLVRLLRDESVFVRRAAMEALGSTGSETAIPALEAAARNDWFAPARQTARRSIRKIRVGETRDRELDRMQDRLQQLEEETRRLREEIELR